MKMKSFSKALFAVMILSLLTFSVVTMTGCNKKPSAVSQTSIAYDGSVFTWDAATNATSYIVRVGDREFQVEDTRCSYPASQSATSTEVEITAVNGKNQSAKTSKIFTKLKTIDQSEITFTPEGVMSWPQVDNASKYRISINGHEYDTDSLEYSEFVYGQPNNIKIKPIGFDNTFYSFYSATIVKTYLATPDTISYDGMSVTWHGDYNATKYQIFINGNMEGESTRKSFDYNANEQSFYVTVKAIGDGRNYFTSKMSEEKSFRYLGTVENLRVVNGELVWDAIEAADSYKVEINGVETGVVTENKIKVTSGSEQNARIKPLSNEGTVYYSAYSPVFKFYIMNAPRIRWNSGLQLDGMAQNAVVWDAVAGNVSGYRVRLTTPDNRVETIENGALTQFSEAYLQTGNYVVEVQTVAGGGTGYYDSDFSTPIKVLRLSAPTVAFDGVTSNEKDVTAGFTVKYSSVYGAQSYKLYRDGTATTISSTTTTISYNNIIDENVTNEQNIGFSIQSIGSVRNIDNAIQVNLDSLSAVTESNPSRFNITVLAMPTNIDIDGDIVSWNSIQGVPGYVVDLGTRTGLYTNQYSLSSIEREGTYSLKLCTMGDGKKVLPSNYSAETTIVKLPAPTNIQIGTSVNEGKLSWDPVENSKSYNVYFNNLDTPVDSGDVDNVNKYIRVDTVALTMQSVANYWNEGHKVYYVSSQLSQTKQFTKIANVTFATPSFTNNELVWNTPSNISANNSVYYRIFDERGILIRDGINATRLSLTELDAGDHTFVIQCIGDGTSFINSEKSDPVSITKLATPVVTRTATAYTWQAVAGASSYAVYVDGKRAFSKEHIAGYTYEFEPSFTELKNYVVDVYAVGDGGFNTIDSNSCEINQKVLQIGTPKFSIAYDKPCFDTSGNIVITITEQPANATGYKYMVDGVVIGDEKTTDIVVNYNTKTTGTKKISVVAYGGCFDESGNYYIDSLAQGGNDESSITLLAKPNLGSIERTGDGRITWAAVSNSKKYLVKVYYSNETPTGTYEPTTAVINNVPDLANIARIEIQAIGNNANIISSEVAGRNF